MAQAPPATLERAYRDDSDWQALHDLAVDAYRRTGRWRTWTPDRFDGFLRGRIYDKAHAWPASRPTARRRARGPA